MHRLTKQERAEKRRILGDYARFRLGQECQESGEKAKVAARLGFTTAHITNVIKNGHGVGVDLLEALAESWGHTRETLFEIAKAWDAGRAAARAEAQKAS